MDVGRGVLMQRVEQALQVDVELLILSAGAAVVKPSISPDTNWTSADLWRLPAGRAARTSLTAPSGARELRCPPRPSTYRRRDAAPPRSSARPASGFGRHAASGPSLCRRSGPLAYSDHPWGALHRCNDTARTIEDKSEAAGPRGSSAASSAGAGVHRAGARIMRLPSANRRPSPWRGSAGIATVTRRRRGADWVMTWRYLIRKSRAARRGGGASDHDLELENGTNDSCGSRCVVTSGILELHEVFSAQRVIRPCRPLRRNCFLGTATTRPSVFRQLLDPS
jgi:hypothetical protein